jgi:hypothetical protein
MLSHKIDLFDLHHEYADGPHADEVLTRLGGFSQAQAGLEGTSLEIARHYIAQIKGGDPKGRCRPIRKT